MDIKGFFKSIYQKVVLIDDSPHKIAGGFALGVFLGILPGLGPIASVALAYPLRVNKAAALAGSLLTNSWFSVLTFAVALKVGSFLTGTDWHKIYTDAKALVEHFQWQKFFDGSSVPILKSLLAGYAAVGAVSGVIVYFIVLMIVVAYRKRKKHTRE